MQQQLGTYIADQDDCANQQQDGWKTWKNKPENYGPEQQGKTKRNTVNVKIDSTSQGLTSEVNVTENKF